MGMTPSTQLLQWLLTVTAPTPVHFFSHGSTMMLGEESESATYWKKTGDEALANGVKGVIMMVGSLHFPLKLN
jgi:aromatic ring-opening dioxygenase catalytic subunit (LigB family)